MNYQSLRGVGFTCHKYDGYLADDISLERSDLSDPSSPLILRAGDGNNMVHGVTVLKAEGPEVTSHQDLFGAFLRCDDVDPVLGQAAGSSGELDNSDPMGRAE